MKIESLTQSFLLEFIFCELINHRSQITERTARVSEVMSAGAAASSSSSMNVNLASTSKDRVVYFYNGMCRALAFTHRRGLMCLQLYHGTCKEDEGRCYGALGKLFLTGIERFGRGLSKVGAGRQLII
jgi:hypothetical protein